MMFAFVVLVVVFSVTAYFSYESGYRAALDSAKVRALEQENVVLKARTVTLTKHIMDSLMQSCFNSANNFLTAANRTADFTVTIQPDNSTLTVYALIRFNEQGNGTMITCR